jgi:hypothetical protein
LGKSPFSIFEAVHFISLEQFKGIFATVNGGFATMTVVVSFYKIISAEPLKNHSKS